MAGQNATTTLRRTVYLPKDLAATAKELVRQGKAKNLSDLMVMALRRMIDQIKREAIDAEFARMGEDLDYQQDALAICREFEASDREAFQRAEAEETGELRQPPPQLEE